MRPCDCSEPHQQRRVVLTGGPGAGKTAVLELICQLLCKHVKVLPEAASIVFGGGFPREQSPVARRAAQRGAVIHLRTPRDTDYNQRNPLRIESAREAEAIDRAIEQAWASHPRRFCGRVGTRFPGQGQARARDPRRRNAGMLPRPFEGRASKSGLGPE